VINGAVVGAVVGAVDGGRLFEVNLKYHPEN
jgi:hypothetical protein